MRYRMPYGDDAERQALLQANSELFLTGEENLLEGNFLVFDDVNPVEPQSEYRKLPMGSLDPAGVDAYIDANVTDLASAKAVLKLYGKAIAWLAKKVNFV